MRLMEDASVKEQAAKGLFCSELFNHTKFAFFTMTEQRKVEPRPHQVMVAAQDLMRGLETSVAEIVDTWMNTALEPREVFAESWTYEVRFLLSKHLADMDIKMDKDKLTETVSSLGWIVKVRGNPRAPTSTPPKMRIHIGGGETTTRKNSTCVARTHDGALLRYGLRTPYRNRLYEILKERGSLFDGQFQKPVTESEIANALDGDLKCPLRHAMP